MMRDSATIRSSLAGQRGFWLALIAGFVLCLGLWGCSTPASEPATTQESTASENTQDSSVVEEMNDAVNGSANETTPSADQ